MEHCLTEHPAVLEVAVIPIEVDGLKRTVLALPYDLASSEIDEGILKAWVGQRIAKYKTPHEISFYPSLPKNDRGKIDKGQLP